MPPPDLPVSRQGSRPFVLTCAGSAAPSVLLAEDNPISQKLARALLSDLGCSVTVAGNGALALELFTTESFDAVLMDMQMPIMDGREATRRIRLWEQRYADRRTPIIAMTGSAPERDREACLQAGMDDQLTKPISRAVLAAAMARLPGLRTEAAMATEAAEADESAAAVPQG